MWSVLQFAGFAAPGQLARAEFWSLQLRDPQRTTITSTPFRDWPRNLMRAALVGASVDARSRVFEIAGHQRKLGNRLQNQINDVPARIIVSETIMKQPERSVRQSHPPMERFDFASMGYRW
jgi:hypothetical protein